MSVSDTSMSNNRLTNDELEKKKKCQEAVVAYLQYDISRCKGREKTIIIIIIIKKTPHSQASICPSRDTIQVPLDYKSP